MHSSPDRPSRRHILKAGGAALATGLLNVGKAVAEALPPQLKTIDITASPKMRGEWFRTQFSAFKKYLAQHEETLATGDSKEAARIAFNQPVVTHEHLEGTEFDLDNQAKLYPFMIALVRKDGVRTLVLVPPGDEFTAQRMKIMSDESTIQYGNGFFVSPNEIVSCSHVLGAAEPDPHAWLKYKRDVMFLTLPDGMRVNEKHVVPIDKNLRDKDLVGELGGMVAADPDLESDVHGREKWAGGMFRVRGAVQSELQILGAKGSYPHPFYARALAMPMPVEHLRDRVDHVARPHAQARPHLAGQSGGPLFRQTAPGKPLCGIFWSGGIANVNGEKRGYGLFTGIDGIKAAYGTPENHCTLAQGIKVQLLDRP